MILFVPLGSLWKRSQNGNVLTMFFSMFLVVGEAVLAADLVTAFPVRTSGGLISFEVVINNLAAGVHRLAGKNDFDSPYVYKLLENQLHH